QRLAVDADHQLIAAAVQGQLATSCGPGPVELDPRFHLLAAVGVAPRHAGALAHAVVGVKELAAIADVEPVAGDRVAIDGDLPVEPRDETPWLIRVSPLREIAGD